MPTNSYTPPGVTVSEVVDPSISPILATPSSVALVAPVTVSGSATNAGGITVTETVKLVATTAVALGTVANTTVSSISIVSVKDATDPSSSEAQTNGVYPSGEGGYVFDSNAKTIRRGNSSSVIPDGNFVYVTYRYTPADYFSAVRMTNIADVEKRFGSAYTSNQTGINSIITYAAAIAFENGALDVILQPLFYDNNGTRQQPTDSQVADDGTWQSTFLALRDIDQINIVVPVIGQSFPNVGDAQQLSIIQKLQSHIKFMKDSEQQQIIAVVGYDNSSSDLVADALTLQADAVALADAYGGDVSENIVFVAPASFTRSTPATSTSELKIGGQYAAVGVAGMIASRPVSQSITRRTLSGFTSVADARTKEQKNEDAGSGLLVIEQKGRSIVVRHGITVNTSSTVKREISVVRAKQRVMESVRDTSEQLIGEVIADGEAPFVVQTAIIGVLEELRGAGDIVDYGDVQARTKSLDPTEIEVRFSYRPAMPVNYISISFSLDLTSGEFDATDTSVVDTSTF